VASSGSRAARSSAEVAVGEVAAGETVDKIWCNRNWLTSLRPT
jgi:hypothetical protein